MTADRGWDLETAAVAKALDAWPFEVERVELMSVSENLVFRVERSGTGPVVARLHRRGYNSLAELESEHAWVRALNRSGAVRASVPIEATDGRSHVSVEVVEGDDRFVGVVDWVTGRPLSHVLEEAVSPVEAVDWYRRAGEVLGDLHSQSTAWHRPAWFGRRSWNVDGMVGPDPLWGRFWEVPGTGERQRDLLLETRGVLHRTLTDFGTMPDRFGLIHADLYADNLFVTNRDLVMIDFDDAGFGWHLYDLAVSVYDQGNAAWFPDVCAAIVAGYRERHDLPQEHVELLPTFLLTRCLALLGWLADRPELDPTGTRLAHDLKSAVRRCEVFLRGADPFDSPPAPIS